MSKSTRPLDLATQREALEAAHAELLRSEILLNIRRRALEDAEAVAGQCRFNFERQRLEWELMLGYPASSIRPEPAGWTLEAFPVESGDIWEGRS
jgi:hypothetical protein